MSSEPDPITNQAFSNLPIEPFDLPQCDAVTFHPIDRRFAFSQWLSYGLLWLVFVAALDLVPRLTSWPWTHQAWPIGLASVIALGHMVLIYKDALSRGWSLRDHDFLYRYGIFWRHQVIVPFARIQHVETITGPIDRLFGICRMRIFTSGGSGGDLDVLGLAAPLAQQIREQLMAQIHEGQEGN